MFRTYLLQWLSLSLLVYHLSAQATVNIKERKTNVVAGSFDNKTFFTTILVDNTTLFVPTDSVKDANAKLIYLTYHTKKTLKKLKIKTLDTKKYENITEIVLASPWKFKFGKPIKAFKVNLQFKKPIEKKFNTAYYIVFDPKKGDKGEFIFRADKNSISDDGIFKRLNGKEGSVRKGEMTAIFNRNNELFRVGFFKYGPKGYEIYTTTLNKKTSKK